MPVLETEPNLNTSVRRTWEALKELTRKTLHDTNNVYGAIQGYLSLLNMAGTRDDQLARYLTAMQEALDTGMVRNKALAAYYREQQVMAIAIDPLETARKASAHSAASLEIRPSISAESELLPLRVEEPAFVDLIGLLCFLALQTDTVEPDISLKQAELSAVQIAEMVMQSNPGVYLQISMTIDTAALKGDVTGFLQPYRMSTGLEADLGVSRLMPILANHNGNLDLVQNNGGLQLNMYFPYPA